MTPTRQTSTQGVSFHHSSYCRGVRESELMPKEQKGCDLAGFMIWHLIDEKGLTF